MAWKYSEIVYDKHQDLSEWAYSIIASFKNVIRQCFQEQLFYTVVCTGLFSAFIGGRYTLSVMSAPVHTAPSEVDEDHPQFDNDSAWPRRLLHIPSMTSHKWQPGNRYGGYKEPQYNAISYTWGRWEIAEIRRDSKIRAIDIKGVPWRIPRIDPEHFTVAEFEHIIRVTRQASLVPLKRDLLKRAYRQTGFPKCSFIWLDIACIDQRRTAEGETTREGKAEIGRQARIFKAAKHVCVWLNHTSHEKLSDINFSLEKLGLADAYTGGHVDWSAEFLDKWCEATSTTLRDLVKDPWFSSLWTLQEAYLCPRAIMLAKNGRPIWQPDLGPKSYLLLEQLVTRVYLISTVIEYEQPYPKSHDWPDLRHLTSLIEESGIAAFAKTRNPMGILTMARYRKTTRKNDRIYGIMQIFGDAFKVGDATVGEENSSRNYTFSELQDEFGSLLVQRYSTMSQLHTHTEPAAAGKGWCISTASTIPLFVSDPRKYKDQVEACSLSTRRVAGEVWGYLLGKGCNFGVFQSAWQRYFSSQRWQRSDENPLEIALDSTAALSGLRLPEINLKDKLAAERSLEITQRLSMHLNDSEVKLFLLAFHNSSLTTVNLDTHTFWGMILLKQATHDTQYWQRIGICQWRCSSRILERSHNLDNEILLTGGNEWHELEGLFG